ncbi:MAG: hypothetical protein JST86_10830 [Bacteroidetes bacterium]|nr:hypothetical protein [Bacteroidota bacterium]
MTEAYLMIRVALGLNILMHGITRLGSKTVFFRQVLQKEFEDTLLPAFLVTHFSRALPILETITGTLLLLGLFSGVAIYSGAAVMLLLIFGKALKSDWQTVSLQMIYVAFYAALAGGLSFNRYSLDALFF